MDGDTEAGFDLGRMYSTTFAGPPDFAKAFAWIAASADQAYPPAETKLGELFQEGIGVKSDMVEALKWLQLAVDAGNKDAISRRDEVASLLDPAQRGGQAPGAIFQARHEAMLSSRTPPGP